MLIACERHTFEGKSMILRTDPPQVPLPAEVPVDCRIGDLAAMLRVMRPLNVSLPDPMVGRRRLLADLCRFIGVKIGSLSPEARDGISQMVRQPLSESKALRAGGKDEAATELSPRLEQTLRHLLAGDSEKQVARKLELSQHTVHVYVKALYRRFAVSSRAELLAKHLKKQVSSS